MCTCGRKRNLRNRPPKIKFIYNRFVLFDNTSHRNWYRILCLSDSFRVAFSEPQSFIVSYNQPPSFYISQPGSSTRKSFYLQVKQRQEKNSSLSLDLVQFLFQQLPPDGTQCPGVSGTGEAFQPISQRFYLVQEPIDVVMTENPTVLP